MDSRIYYWKNGAAVQNVSYDYLFVDPENSSITKRIGTLERLETLINHYHGHIYCFVAWNSDQITSNMANDYMIETNCDSMVGCGICPAVDTAD